MSDYRYKDALIEAPYQTVFAYIADPTNLPKWTHAFKEVGGCRAVLRTPTGSIDIGLDVRTSKDHGTIDWFMTFPDRSVAAAYSRLTELSSVITHYGFLLTPPPAPLEQLEGMLDEQAKILEMELASLRKLLRV